MNVIKFAFICGYLISGFLIQGNAGDEVSYDLEKIVTLNGNTYRDILIMGSDANGHNHPIELSTNEILQQRIGYIHNNPVEAGFVKDPSDWQFSSAGDYEGETGEIDIYFLDQ